MSGIYFAASLEPKPNCLTSSLNKTERLRQLHQQMIHEIQDYAIILLDIDGTILTWNKGAQAIKGYKEEEIVGQNFRIFYMPRDRDEKLPEKGPGILAEG
jgi:PAS domain S-box-containing protein